jgi:hypothetical protein
MEWGGSGCRAENFHLAVFAITPGESLMRKRYSEGTIVVIGCALTSILKRLAWV